MRGLLIVLGYVCAPLAAAAASLSVELMSEVLSGRSIPNPRGLPEWFLYLYVVCFVVGLPFLLILRLLRVRSAVAFLLCAIALAAAATPFMQMFVEVLSHGHARPSGMYWKFILANVATLTGTVVFWLIAVRSPNPTVEPTRVDGSARGSP